MIQRVSFGVTSWIDVVARNRRYDPLNHTNHTKRLELFSCVLWVLATWAVSVSFGLAASVALSALNFRTLAPGYIPSLRGSLRGPFESPIGNRADPTRLSRHVGTLTSPGPRQDCVGSSKRLGMFSLRALRLGGFG